MIRRRERNNRHSLVHYKRLNYGCGGQIVNISRLTCCDIHRSCSSQCDYIAGNRCDSQIAAAEYYGQPRRRKFVCGRNGKRSFAESVVRQGAETNSLRQCPDANFPNDIGLGVGKKNIAIGINHDTGGIPDS